MANFFFGYHGGKKPETPEEGAEMMAKWKSWIEDLGNAMVNPGNPVGKSWTVGADGAKEGWDSSPLMGFSIIQADDLEGAVAIARSCPFVEMETATIEVAEMMEMTM